MVGGARPPRLRGSELRLSLPQRGELGMGLGLALAGRAVEGDVRGCMQGHTGKRVAVVVHPEAAVVATRHVLVRRQPHLQRHDGVSNAFGRRPTCYSPNIRNFHVVCDVAHAMCWPEDWHVLRKH